MHPGERRRGAAEYYHFAIPRKRAPDDLPTWRLTLCACVTRYGADYEKCFKTKGILYLLAAISEKVGKRARHTEVNLEVCSDADQGSSCSTTKKSVAAKMVTRP